MSAATAEAAEAASGKKNKVVLIIVIAAAAIVLIAAGVIAMTMFGGSKEAELDPAKEPGDVVTLEDTMTLNLVDGKFLKTGLALQLSEAATKELGEAGVKAFDGSKARDAAITILGKYDYNQLLDPKTKDAAQQALSTEVRKRYDGVVLRVYFTEFVMQ